MNDALSDKTFLSRFDEGSLDRLTWLLVQRHGRDGAQAATASGIRRFAGHKGRSQKYHETLTRFWVGIVAHAMEERPDLKAFDPLMGASPMLLDKSLPERHWSHERLFSPAARAEWVEPGHRPCPPGTCSERTRWQELRSDREDTLWAE